MKKGPYGPFLLFKHLAKIANAGVLFAAQNRGRIELTRSGGWIPSCQQT